MRALLTQGQGRPLVVGEVPDPSPGDGELLVRVEHCGICGSDLHLVDAFDLTGHILGHEFGGEVVGVGPGVDGWKVGDRLAALSLVTCGTCDECRAGRVRKCSSALATGAETPGAFSELAVVRAHDAKRLPGGFSGRHGALVEPLAVARHSVERAGPIDGATALVIGGGPVGLAVLIWLREMGAEAVAVSEPQPVRRAMAERLGADVVFDPTEGGTAASAAAGLGAAPAVVIECVGIPGMIEEAASAAAIDGRVVVAGVCFSPDQINPLGALSKELDLRFTFYYRSQDYDATIEAIDRGRLDPTRLITGEVSLDEAPERFERLKGPSDDAKVLITPGFSRGSPTSGVGEPHKNPS